MLLRVDLAYSCTSESAADVGDSPLSLASSLPAGAAVEFQPRLPELEIGGSTTDIPVNMRWQYGETDIDEPLAPYTHDQPEYARAFGTFLTHTDEKSKTLEWLTNLVNGLRSHGLWPAPRKLRRNEVESVA